MPDEQIHTVVLGAGPSGLAAGYLLANAGINPIVLEKDHYCGGLMRSIRRGDFVVDIGRKELYNRLAKVDRFWGELLGDDYRIYQHRGGILYDGRILEISPAYRGFRRGMPWGTLFRCGVDFLWCRLQIGAPKPRNLEDYFYQSRGRLLTQIVSQGFQEKLTGKKWADTPLPKEENFGRRARFLETFKNGLKRAFVGKENNTYQGIWRHPAQGTGQICEALAKGILAAGGRIHYGARLVGLTPGQGKVSAVTAEIGSETVVYRPRYVVSSIPAELVSKFLLAKNNDAAANPYKVPENQRKTIILVYLFLNERPRFPHVWLQITCPKMKLGRISNYAAQNGSMVPPGKTCLCCEFYCVGADSMVRLTDQELTDVALAECAQNRLVDPGKCFDSLAVRLPGADASQNRSNFLSPNMLRFLTEIRQFDNLYYVNRPDTDVATLAGLEAAEAILTGNKAQFDRRADPTQLEIRSLDKPFEFSNPAARNVRVAATPQPLTNHMG